MPAIAVPNRSPVVHSAAAASGVNASAPLTSLDHASVYPRSGSAATRLRWLGRGILRSGSVMPHLGVDFIRNLRESDPSCRYRISNPTRAVLLTTSRVRYETAAGEGRSRTS